MKRELIDRAAALAGVAEWEWQELYLPAHFKQVIEDCPTVEERRRGRWKVYTAESGFAHLECGACGGWMLGKQTPFCPYCGAEMENSGKEPAEEKGAKK